MKKTYLLAYPLYLLVLIVILAALLEAFLRHKYSDRITPISPGRFTRETVAYPDLPQEFVHVDIRKPWMSFSYTLGPYGARIPDQPDQVKLAQGEVATVFLGDSYTFGWGVGYQDVFGALFEKLTNQSGKCLICGEGGRGTEYHLRQLERVLRSERQVKTVIYQIFGNDLLQDLGLPKRANEELDSHTRALKPKIVALLKKHIPYITLINLRGMVNAYHRLMGEKINFKTRKNYVFPNYGPILKDSILSDEDKAVRDRLIGLYQERVKKLIQIARDAHVRLIGLLMPYAEYAERSTADSAYIDLAGDTDEQSNNRYRAWIAGIFREEGAPLIDLYPVFERAHRENPGLQLYLDKDLHLNRAGHALVARTLAEFLQNNPGEKDDGGLTALRPGEGETGKAARE